MGEKQSIITVRTKIEVGFLFCSHFFSPSPQSESFILICFQMLWSILFLFSGFSDLKLKPTGKSANNKDDSVCACVCVQDRVCACVTVCVIKIQLTEGNGCCHVLL